MLTIQSALPDPSISHFVHSFWRVENQTGEDVSSTVLPNGMVDMSLMKMNSDRWVLVGRGLDTMPKQVTMAPNTILFSIGFKLLAVEYLLGDSIKDVLNEDRTLSNDFWQFDEADVSSLESFCSKATQKIKAVSPESIDSRKKKLFDLIYSSQGSMSVNELSENVCWSSRQINRYFNQQFGISLKTYCTILRFGASFKNISEGKLFSEQEFTDQNHFIKSLLGNCKKLVVRSTL